MKFDIMDHTGHSTEAFDKASTADLAIECERRVVLQMWAPAGEIFKSMDFRDKARKVSK